MVGKAVFFSLCKTMLLQNMQTFKYTSLPSGLTLTEIATYKAKNRLKTIVPSLTVVTYVPLHEIKGQGEKERETDTEHSAFSCTF